MAVRRDDVVAVHVLDDVRDELPVVGRHREADGVGDVQRGRAVVDRDLADLAHEVGIAAVAVFGRELHVVGVRLGSRDGGGRFRPYLVGRHLQLLLHVDLRRRDEHMDAGLLGVVDRFPRPVDVLEAGPRERADGRAVHGLRDRLDGLEVALRRDREPRLDDVDAEARELVRDLELLGDVERDARGLLAVTQGRVEDQDVVHLAARFVRRGIAATKNPPARRLGGRCASTSRRPRSRKEEAQQVVRGAQLQRHGPMQGTGNRRGVNRAST